MPTFVHSNRPVFTLPGLRHQTLAGGADGLARLEIWYQSLDQELQRRYTTTNVKK
jgi:hypothetical protein